MPRIVAPLRLERATRSVWRADGRVGPAQTPFGTSCTFHGHPNRHRTSVPATRGSCVRLTDPARRGMVGLTPVTAAGDTRTPVVGHEESYAHPTPALPSRPLTGPPRVDPGDRPCGAGRHARHWPRGRGRSDTCPGAGASSWRSRRLCERDHGCDRHGRALSVFAELRRRDQPRPGQDHRHPDRSPGAVVVVDRRPGHDRRVGIVR